MSMSKADARAKLHEALDEYLDAIEEGRVAAPSVPARRTRKQREIVRPPGESSEVAARLAAEALARAGFR